MFIDKFKPEVDCGKTSNIRVITLTFRLVILSLGARKVMYFLFSFGRVPLLVTFTYYLTVWSI